MSHATVALVVDDALTLLRKHGTVLFCPQRSEFCQQGNTPDQVFLVDEGLVTLSVISDEGREYFPGYRSRGWLLGTASVLSNTPHSSSLRAQTAVKVLVIPARNFRQALRDYPQVSDLVHELHAQEIAEQTRKLASLALCSTRQRVEEFLWEILPTLATSKGKVHLPFSDVEITKFVSATPQYLSGIFKNLEDEGIIERKNGWLIVPDPSRLWHR